MMIPILIGIVTGAIIFLFSGDPIPEKRDPFTECVVSTRKYFPKVSEQTSHDLIELCVKTLTEKDKR